MKMKSGAVKSTSADLAKINAEARARGMSYGKYMEYLYREGAWK